MKSLLQTDAWAAFRQSLDWSAYKIDNISILEKKLYFGKSFLYAPEADWKEVSPIGGLQNKLDKINKITQNSHTIFFRLELINENNDKIIKNLKDFGFIKAFEEIQPEWRQIIDISKSEEEILAQMKPKGRYNIKIAQKHNVKIEIYSQENFDAGLDIFYDIFCQTAKEQGFSIRPKEYFTKLTNVLYPPGYCQLIIGRYQNKPVAGAIITYYNGVASYLYGASLRENRQIMAPYLLHWEAIKQAKAKNCHIYDLLAVAPEGIENHKYDGIGRFKRQFGGKTVHIVGSWDYIYKPVWYWMFKKAERYRRR